MKPLILLSFLLLTACFTASCSMIPGGDIWVAGALQKGQDAADDVLATGEWTVCDMATIGSIRRRYGKSAEAAERYRDFCDGPAVDLIAPGE